MEDLTFADSLSLKQIAEDTFTNIHRPWTWHGGPIIPGGVLMSECAVAAYHTVPDDFVLDSLQAQFLGGPKAELPMHFKVTRLSNGRRFAVRSVVIEQEGVTMLHASITFVNKSPWTGPAMNYSVHRRTNHNINEITIDDLERGRTRLGPFMKFQRLPLVYQDSGHRPEFGIATSAAHIIPPIREPAGARTHILGVINLSDYHVMDAALQLSDISFGYPKIGDTSRTQAENDMKVGTSLNHSIHFHAYNGFRADNMTYVEVGTSWARDGRAMLNSHIFSKEGLLIATCCQEAFYVLKKDPPARSDTKL